MLYHYELARQEVNARFEQYLREAECDRRCKGLRKAQTTIEGTTKMSLGAKVAAAWFSFWNRPQLSAR
jgi:hypothetical protein